MMGFGVLGMLLFWGLLFALFVGGAGLLSRQTARVRATSGPRRPTARRILDERLARGEISHEEYEVIRTRIEGTVGDEESVRL